MNPIAKGCESTDFTSCLYNVLQPLSRSQLLQNKLLQCQGLLH